MVDLGASNMEIIGKLDFVDFVGRVVAALSDTPDTVSAGGVDLAYVHRVREERDRAMAIILNKVIKSGPATVKVDTPGHTICTAGHNALQLTWDPPGASSKRRPCANGPERCVAVGLTSGIMGTLPSPGFIVTGSLGF